VPCTQHADETGCAADLGCNWDGTSWISPGAQTLIECWEWSTHCGNLFETRGNGNYFNYGLIFFSKSNVMKGIWGGKLVCVLSTCD